MKMVYKSLFESDTEKIGEKLAGGLNECVVALFGTMGMGKTAFVRGMAKGLSYSGEVTSPTFAIVHEYSGGRLPLYHFDMYRITGFDDLYSCGFFDYLDCGVLAVEWSENIKEFLPENYIKVTLSRGAEDNTRLIEIITP